MSFGYRHDMLNAYEAFWAPRTKTVSPLKNDIHPLWKQDNFRMGSRREMVERCVFGLDWDDASSRMPDDLYKTIEPALRLASMFLAYSRPFYMMILRANEVPVKGINVLVREGLLQNRTMLQCLDPNWLPRPEDEKAYDEAIGEIAGDFRLYCGDNSSTIFPDSLVYAATNHASSPRFWIYNFFASDYFEEFASSRFRHISVQQRHRLLFQFTITLLHELAHVMLRKRRQNDVFLQYEPEPLFEPNDVTAELGHAWETWAFGGTMYPTGFPVDMRNFGLRWCPWLWAMNPSNTTCLDYPYGEFVIHASTMSRFFSTTGWDKHKNGVQPLAVELTPLRALYGNVEDKKGDDYAANYQYRLECVHRGRSSAFIRNYCPHTPPLPPLPMDIDIEVMTTTFSKAGRKILKRRVGRLKRKVSIVAGARS